MVPLITIPASVTGFLFGGLCLVLAIKRGALWVSIVVTGALFGFLLEYTAVKTPHTYSYCQFEIMLLNAIPAMIVVAWGGLIYSVMRTSDALRLKWWLRPFYEGVLAMGIDLTLDPIAISLGYWKYDQKDPAEWFGVPFGNYLGWFGMVFWFSMSLRCLARLVKLPTRPNYWRVLLPPGAAVVALIPFGLMMATYAKFVSNQPIEPYVFSVFFLTVLGLMVRHLPSLPKNAPIDPASLAAPIFFGIFQNLILFAAPLLGAESPIHKNPGLVILTPMTTLFVLVAFCWPFIDTLGERFRPKHSLLEEAQSDELSPIV